MRHPLRLFAVLIAMILCWGGVQPAARAQAQPSVSSSAYPDIARAGAAPAPPPEMIVIPGPLRSFLRMAGISQEVEPDEILPMLSRNIFLRGYEVGGETEFLRLLDRYVQFAREIQPLTDPQGMIQVSGCADAARLLQVLGYEFQGTCGQKDAYLLTANPERAFLTIDSGFPLTALEEALARHTAFSYAFPATPVPILFRERDWTSLSTARKRGNGALLDVLLHDPAVDRLYWAMSKEDQQTRMALHHAPGLRTLLPLGPALDFYGGQICIRSGSILLPGGRTAEHGWEELAGANPNHSGEFVEHLLGKDHGWLAAYFDALSRVPEEQQRHLTQAPRLRHLYEVYRAAGGGNYATRGVFQSNADLLMLFTRLQWQSDGEPLIPGNLAVWREIMTQNTSPRLVRGWIARARTWDDPEQLLETLVACSGFQTDVGPLQIYLTLSAIDSERAPGARLDVGTVRLMAGRFAQFHTWYMLFTEFPTLNDTSITRFINAAETIDGVSSNALRANALGAFQANLGLWEVFGRQQQIPAAGLNTSFQNAIQPFSAATSSPELFDAARTSLRAIVVAAGGSQNLSQDEIVELLAGPRQASEEGRRVHQKLVERIRAVLDDQRLVSLDTLFALYDGLDQMAHGSVTADSLIPLAGSLREFEMPRAIFTSSERNQWAPEIYTSRHAELQVRTDLTRTLRSHATPAQLEAARGQLTPFLRDSLVGLNYAYYEPPDAQVLHHNPLFVRSHDFSGTSILGTQYIWGSPELIGIGVTAGGGAYLIGSLADLPYALATTEEDFIAPENVQALIWREAVPALLVGAIEPRWWNVTPAEMHAAALYQRAGEELLIASTGNAELRSRVVGILSNRLAPRRLDMTQRALEHSADINTLIAKMLPAETFYLAAAFRRQYPAEAGSWGAAGKELDALIRSNPSETSVERLSRDFGVPHPTLEQSNACELLNLRPFPAFGGDPSRLFGESWESSNLYWARLADETHYPPVMLNVLVPQLTRHMVARIFATDIEDWPAILRAMEQTGQDFRQGRIPVPGAILISQN